MTQLEHNASEDLAPPAPAADDAVTGVVVQLRRKRAHTTSIRRLSKRDLERGRSEYPPEEMWRPRTRGDCGSDGANSERPCPFVSCRHHLALDIHPERGSIKVNFPDLEPDELPQTCALDIAEVGGITLEQIASVMNLTRERVRQLETAALAKLPPELLAKLLPEAD